MYDGVDIQAGRLRGREGDGKIRSDMYIRGGWDKRQRTRKRRQDRQHDKEESAEPRIVQGGGKGRKAKKKETRYASTKDRLTVYRWGQPDSTWTREEVGS